MVLNAFSFLKHCDDKPDNFFNVCTDKTEFWILNFPHKSLPVDNPKPLGIAMHFRKTVEKSKMRTRNILECHKGEAKLNQ